jgi:RHS repeat-associated protein
VTESYTYDADGRRVTKTRNGVTTWYLEGLWEETSDGLSRKAYYALNGAPVAVRELVNQQVAYLHSDHLGSVSVTTNTSGVVTDRQYFDPWGSRLSGTVGATPRNFTGQYLDDTGLLFYNARYYDPVIGRFISADSVVPGGGPLTLAPYDEVATSAWTAGGGGPANPQDLNRYTYVLNNPVNLTDPTGHCGVMRTGPCGGGRGFGSSGRFSAPDGRGGSSGSSPKGSNPTGNTDEARLTAARQARERAGKSEENPNSPTYASDGKQVTGSQNATSSRTTINPEAEARKLVENLKTVRDPLDVNRRLNPTHAEPKIVAVSPDTYAYGVSRQLCPSCMSLFRRLAQQRKETIAVSAPRQEYLFYSDGTQKVMTGPK